MHEWGVSDRVLQAHVGNVAADSCILCVLAVLRRDVFKGAVPDRPLLAQALHFIHVDWTHSWEGNRLKSSFIGIIGYQRILNSCCIIVIQLLLFQKRMIIRHRHLLCLETPCSHPPSITPGHTAVTVLPNLCERNSFSATRSWLQGQPGLLPGQMVSGGVARRPSIRAQSRHTWGLKEILWYLTSADFLWGGNHNVHTAEQTSPPSECGRRASKEGLFFFSGFEIYSRF